MSIFRHYIAALAGLAVIIAGIPARLLAAASDGTATFTVTLSDPSGNYNRRVDAYWVTDANGNFVQTVRKDAATRQGYLYKWAAARGSWTAVDGTSGATISTWSTFSVTWDGKNTNEVTVPDGQYKFYFEMTDYNGQGNWTTNGLTFTKGPNPSTNTYPDQPYITGMKVVYIPIAAPHDVAVTAITPAYAPIDASSTVSVRITNTTDSAETCTLTLSNLTSGTLIGTLSGLGLAGNTATNLAFTWNTAGLALGTYTLEAAATMTSTNDTAPGNNAYRADITVRNPTHDLDLELVSTPVMVTPNASSNVTLKVSNAGDFTEAFDVLLYDDTLGRLVASNRIGSLAPFTPTNLTLLWTATNMSAGFHALRAVAGPAAGETEYHQADNTRTALVVVASSTTTVTLIATNNLWRYDDTGRDYGATPWTELNFYDDNWKSGRSPLGYADSAYLPALSTVIGYGSNASAKYMAAYFRSSCYLDAPPTALTLSLMRDDGFVLYFNGQEVLRNNMNSGPVAITNAASATVNNPETTNYVSYTLPTTAIRLLRPGLNEIAIEVHQVSAGSSDLSMSMKLTATVPSLTAIHDVAVVTLRPAGSALTGEILPVDIILTNRGSAAETLTVYLVNATNNTVLASQILTNVAPGQLTTVTLNWRSGTTSVGDIPLKAYTSVNGASTGTASAQGSIVSPTIMAPTAGAIGALGGRCTAVAAAGPMVVTGAGAVLQTWDATQPTALIKQGSVHLPGIIEAISLTGSYAYAACGAAGVQVVDVRQPASPSLVGAFDTAGYAYKLRAEGNTLFVAAGRAGLKVLDLSNPASPTLKGTYPTEGPARDFHSVGNLVYLLDQYKGLQIVGLASPATPLVWGGVKFEGGTHIAVANNRAYVLDAGGKLRVINVQTVSAPVAITNVQLGGVFTRGLAASNTIVYVAAQNGGILTLNAAATPVPVATNSAGESILGLALAGSTLYAADGYAGVQALDISTPAAPRAAASFATGSRAADVVLRDNQAYVAAGESGLLIYEVSNPARPVLRGIFAGATNARSLAVAGTLACVGEGQGGFKLVNVSDPAHPALAGAYANTNMNSIRAVAMEGTFATMTDGQRLYLFDIANPAIPQLVATQAVTGFGLGVAMASNTVWVAAGSGGILTYGYSASGLAPAGGYSTPGVANAVTIANGRAFVSKGSGGWLVLDTANPAAPALISSRAEPANALGIAGTLLAVSGGTGPMQVSDISNLLTPVPQTALGPLVRALKLSTSGVAAAAAEDEAGLALFSLGGAGDLNQDGLPDNWQMQLVNASLATNGLIRSINDVRPGDDLDGDGFSNLAEFVAGTSPTDRSSVFAAQAPARDENGAPSVIRWLSVAGKTYTLLESTNLATGFTVLQDNIPATPPINTFTNRTPNAAAFYLLSVR